MSTGPADKALDTFKSLIYDPLVEQLVVKTIALAGFLSWGPIAFVVSKVITWVANELYEHLSRAINFQVILLQNELHHRDYVKAAKALKEEAERNGIDSPQFREARAKHKAALSRFVRYTGT